MKIIDLHYSWLVINSIIGCPQGCKYCFLFNKLPEIKTYATPEESVEQLLNFKYYDNNIPLCLFPNTDIFLNDSNISYLINLLDVLDQTGITNDITLITKCEIPKDVLEKIKEFQLKGHNIVIYLSYSGLDQTVEPNINKNDLLINFKNLNEYEIPVIHYYRPFLPQNSKPEQISKLLKNIENYSDVCAINGLMIDSSRLEYYDFWKELQGVDKKELSHVSSVWPEDAWNFFQNDYQGSQNIYFANSCALNSVLRKPCTLYYGMDECLQSKTCDSVQRERCQRAFERLDFNFILEKLQFLLKQFHLEEFQYIVHPNHSIEIIGEPLPPQIFVYFNHVLGVKVFSKNGIGLNELFNSSLNSAKPYILRREKKNE